MPDKPRIALVNSASRYTGVGNYTHSLFESLKAASYDVSLFSYEGKFVNALFTKLGGHNASNSLPRHLPIMLTGVMRYVDMSLYFRSIPRSFDIYHLTSGTMSFTVTNYERMVASVHDVWIFTMGLRMGEQRLIKSSMIKALQRSKSIICPSEFTKTELINHMEISSSKIKVVPYGTDHDLFKPGPKHDARVRAGLSLHKKIILHVGSEEPRKNLPTLLKAFAVLASKYDDVMLVRVGTKTETTSKIINEMKLNDKVLYLRPDAQQLAYLYRSADLLAFPSNYEGFGLPPLEAMCSGCPVVAGNAASLPEVVGDAGVLVDPNDPYAFAREFENVLTNESKSNEMMARGLEKGSRYSWETYVKSLEPVYQSIMSS